MQKTYPAFYIYFFNDKGLKKVVHATFAHGILEADQLLKQSTGIDIGSKQNSKIQCSIKSEFFLSDID